MKTPPKTKVALPYRYMGLAFRTCLYREAGGWVTGSRSRVGGSFSPLAPTH